MFCLVSLLVYFLEDIPCQLALPKANRVLPVRQALLQNLGSEGANTIPLEGMGMLEICRFQLTCFDCCFFTQALSCCSTDALSALGDAAAAFIPTQALIVAFFTFKGGVGKTTLSNLLAYILAKLGFSILLIDADRQCNLTLHFQDNPKHENHDAAEVEKVHHATAGLQQLIIQSTGTICLHLPVYSVLYRQAQSAWLQQNPR